MDAKTAELFEQLPADVREAVKRDDELTELVRTLAHKPPPAGRVLRLWSLGSLQARIAAGYFGLFVRSAFADTEKKERLKSEAHLAAAVKLLEGMGYMRGLVMKVGQFLGTYPDFVPEEFSSTLAALHFEAPPMHFSLLREQVRRELGDEPENLFAEFETEAFAAASLGQVHRARTKDGERVAVKIQYPSIARTVRSDMANMQAFTAPLRFTKDFDNLREVIADIAETMIKETDYVRELEETDKARELFADIPGLVVPRTFPEYSSERVMTVELLEGVHLEQYLATKPSQEERDAHAERFVRACMRMIYGARKVYADPHPGNFVFMEDGRLGMLDFGCCRKFTDHEWDIMEVCLDSVDDRGEPLRQAICLTLDMPWEELEGTEHYSFMVENLEWMYAPFVHDGPFDFGDDEYLRRGMELVVESIRRGYTRHMPMVTWTERQFLGDRALAHALGARLDLRKIDHEEMRRAGVR